MRPVKRSMPSTAGMRGVEKTPLQTTTKSKSRISSLPAARTVTFQRSPSGATFATSVPTRMRGRRPNRSA